MSTLSSIPPPEAAQAQPGDNLLQFALVSHTNAGKTTLARTLLRSDIGEVRDAAHVTQASTAHPVLAASTGEQLLLWDTPGFGDSVRLYRRLAMSGNPVGWFLSQVLDRLRDRPFWLSQQAMRTAREQADLVLYLVNASEDPRDAGYLAPEMKILAWLDKPVLVLLNQMGVPRPRAEEAADEERWRQALADYPQVKKVLSLDAFARCWVHEQLFFEAAFACLPDSRRGICNRLLQAWKDANQKRFQEAMRLLCVLVADAARDSEPLPASAPQSVLKKLLQVGRGGEQEPARRAMDAMGARYQRNIEASTAELLLAHGLDAGAASTIIARVGRAYTVKAGIDSRQAGLLGALVTGAGSGLAADLMSGGLTLGAGALVGALAGALTFSGAAWAFNAGTDRQQPRLRFSDDFLRSLVVSSVLRYLAVAHFGRGRGGYVEGEAPAFWQQEVEAVVARHAGTLESALRQARQGKPLAERSGGQEFPHETAQQSNKESTPAAQAHTAQSSAQYPALQRQLASITLEVLARLYPDLPHHAAAKDFSTSP